MNRCISLLSVLIVIDTGAEKVGGKILYGFDKVGGKLGQFGEKADQAAKKLGDKLEE